MTHVILISWLDINGATIAELKYYAFILELAKKKLYQHENYYCISVTTFVANTYVRNTEVSVKLKSLFTPLEKKRNKNKPVSTGLSSSLPLI